MLQVRGTARVPRGYGAANVPNHASATPIKTPWIGVRAQKWGRRPALQQIGDRASVHSPAIHHERLPDCVHRQLDVRVGVSRGHNEVLASTPCLSNSGGTAALTASASRRPLTSACP